MSQIFHHTPEALRGLTETLIAMAQDLGATDVSAEVSEGSGLSVSVRMGELETLEHHRDKGAAVTVYIGTRRGHATTSDFSTAALKAAVQRAYDIARFTGEDPFAGLPDLADVETSPQAVDLYRPWEIDAKAATALALRCEKAALSTDRAIRNSEGASVNVGHGQFHSAHTRGFSGGYTYSRHGLGVSPIAQVGDLMQRDYWSSSHRDPKQLSNPEAIGRYAAQRALSRLGARSLATQTCPVLFEAPLAVGLVGGLVQAISGSSLYRKASFLNDSLGQQVLPEHISIFEDPFEPLGLGTSPFDDEGVRVRARTVVESGVVKGYFLSTYTARKMGMAPTGNAGGAHNLRMVSRQTRPGDNLEAMLRKLDRGLFVTEMMGQGVNGLTGDYSRGAFGYWVEGGEIQYPVEEITIAGNLKDMLRDIVAVGADTITRGTKTTGSVLVGSMTVGGQSSV